MKQTQRNRTLFPNGILPKRKDGKVDTALVCKMLSQQGAIDMGRGTPKRGARRPVKRKPIDLAFSTTTTNGAPDTGDGLRPSQRAILASLKAASDAAEAAFKLAAAKLKVAQEAARIAANPPPSDADTPDGLTADQRELLRWMKEGGRPADFIGRQRDMSLSTAAADATAGDASTSEPLADRHGGPRFLLIEQSSSLPSSLTARPNHGIPSLPELAGDGKILFLDRTTHEIWVVPIVANGWAMRKRVVLTDASMWKNFHAVAGDGNFKKTTEAATAVNMPAEMRKQTVAPPKDKVLTLDKQPKFRKFMQPGK